MKSHHKYRFWFVSLLVHLCLAMVLSFVIINQTTLSDVDALEVSILEVKPVPPVKKTPRVEVPIVTPPPTPKFQIEPQSTSAQTRAFHNLSGEDQRLYLYRKPQQWQPQFLNLRHNLHVPKFLSKEHLSVNDRPAQLATAVDLPVQSDAPLASGLSGGSSLSGSGGIGEGSGVGRGGLRFRGRGEPNPYKRSCWYRFAGRCRRGVLTLRTHLLTSPTRSR